MTIRDELDVINTGFGEAFATGDAERLAAFYADDARLLLHGQPIIRRRSTPTLSVAASQYHVNNVAGDHG